MSNGLGDEENARAEVYALLSNVFYMPPSKELLGLIASGISVCNHSQDAHDALDSDFCQAWRALQQSAARTDAETVEDEFNSAFIGTGRQPVMLYGSFYAAGFLH